MNEVTILAALGGGLFTLLSFIVALSIIVTVHEYGHYIVGRWSGIHAEVFSLGFGPVLASRIDKRGTRWQVAAIPLGGYVKFLGDANAASAGRDEETLARLSDRERRHTMHGAPLWARAATVFAGPGFNFILSVLIFAGFAYGTGVVRETPVVGALAVLPGGTGELRPGDEILAVGGTPVATSEEFVSHTDEAAGTSEVQYLIRRDGQELSVSGPVFDPPRVSAVMAKSAAMDAGLQPDDVILAADGAELARFGDLYSLVRASEGKPLVLTIWRAGETLTTTLTPRERPVPAAGGGFETVWQIGVLAGSSFELATRDPGAYEALSLGVKATYRYVEGTFAAIGSMFAGKISSCTVSGAITIAQVSGEAASRGLGDFLWMIAALSTAVAFANLLPIPVLDGGHLVFHAYEWARGRPPSDRVMNIAMSIGLFLVLALMMFGILNDLRCN